MGLRANADRDQRRGSAGVDALGRALLEQAAPTCPRFELRVVLAVTSLLTLHSRLWDSMATTQVAAIVHGVEVDDVTAGQRDRVAVALRSLGSQGLIGWRPGRGRTAFGVVSLAPEYLPASGGVSVEKAYGTERETPPIPGAKAHPQGGHSSVLSSEKSSDQPGQRFTEECPNGCDAHGWIEVADKTAGAGAARKCEHHPTGRIAA